MLSPDPNSSGGAPPADSRPTIPGPDLGRRVLPGRLWPWALVAGLAAGLGGSLGGELLFGRFEPVIVRPPDWASISPFDKPNILSGLLKREVPRAELKNAAMSYGLLGAMIAGSLGSAAGLARRSSRAASAATCLGILAGGATGAGMSAILVPVFFRTLEPESGMMLGLLIHAGIWVPIGAAAGVAFGFGLGGPRRIALAAIGGIAGAALGTMVYEVANGLAFPNARLDRPIPGERHSRLLADFSVAVFTALGAAMGVGGRGREADADNREA